MRPDLVLVDASGLPCLLDVGLAPGLVEAAKSRDEFRARPCHDAPESEGAGALSLRGAVYAIGATLSFALTGSPVAELRGTERFEHLPLTMVSTIPGPLAELLAKATAYEPAERVPDPATLRQALEGASPGPIPPEYRIQCGWCGRRSRLPGRASQHAPRWGATRRGAPLVRGRARCRPSSGRCAARTLDMGERWGRYGEIWGRCVLRLAALEAESTSSCTPGDTDSAAFGRIQPYSL